MKKNLIKGAFTIKKVPFPWERAICAGISSAVPVLIGLLFGNFQYGLIAGIGGFSYLYVWNEPYPQRAKKIFFVALGLAVSNGLGILTAPSPFVFAVILGLIGAVGTFIFGALKIPGPASIFFVIVFAMTSASHVDPTLVPLRAGLVFLGGAFAWLVAMAGWFLHPHGPEIKSVKRIYLELAALIDSVGTEQFNDAREKTVLALNDANSTLLAGYVSWKSSTIFKQLYLLKEQANSILLDILEMAAEGRTNLPPAVGETVQALAHSLDRKKSEPMKILQPKETDQAVDRLFSKIYDADAIMNEPISRINQDLKITKPTLISIFLDAFDKNSIVFLSSLKYGIVLMIAAMIAFGFNFNRSYWIPVSCGAVMLGSTIIATFHRAIQRAIGTIVGIIIASIILSIQPAGIWVALFILFLGGITELFMVRNYAFAVMFITPNSLMMAESTTQIHNLSYFATARITDILIGAIIGLIGVLLVGRRSASSRLPHLIAKTIRSQSQLFFKLHSEQKNGSSYDGSRERNKMRTNLINLRTVYTTALGEIPNHKKKLEYLSPAIFSMEQLEYLLELSSKDSNRPVLSDEILAQFLLVFETMAKSVEQHDLVTKKKVPEIEGYSKLQKEIISLQEALKLVRDQVNVALK
ncbi:FUSC family protein [Neobacillus drentensis]|uniref:FUSC family protein n=1 Tax=Neobacillus drentensis TaxID=220684 RepID=UPI0008251CD7|nr:FUSC family protein [Neobacillus drentensis]